MTCTDVGVEMNRNVFVIALVLSCGIHFLKTTEFSLKKKSVAVETPAEETVIKQSLGEQVDDYIVETPEEGFSESGFFKNFKGIKDKYHELTGRNKGLEQGQRFISKGFVLNKELCNLQSAKFEKHPGYNNYHSLEFYNNPANVRNISERLLNDYQFISTELSKFSLIKGEELIKTSGFNPRFILNLEEAQVPCHENPKVLTSFVENLSKYLQREKSDPNWAIYKTAEINLMIVKELDSFEALSFGLKMLEALAKDGHMKEQDLFAIKKLKGKIKSVNTEYQQELLENELNPLAAKATVAHYNDQKVLYKLKIRTYLRDITRRYPSFTPEYDTRLPELI